MRHIVIFIIVINVSLITSRPKDYLYRNLTFNNGNIGTNKNVNSTTSTDKQRICDSSTRECVAYESGEHIGVSNPPRPPKTANGLGVSEDIHWSRSPYQVDGLNNAQKIVTFTHFSKDMQLSADPKLLAELNPMPPITRLPKVLVNRQDIVGTKRFDPQFYHLTSRVTRDDDDMEEFMKQLAHDANMDNILPTMEVPLARSRSYGNEKSSSVAVYPGNVNDCGVPILFSCVPNVNIGFISG
ncbi:unnamed protein product [Diatraea saccharalis]|uniref:Uncharacterized protein n=1 Tax=Diatraea saccharalis TaxID=40085 RepID=A0A9N9QV17_9NEOP|nr:unnamed protein product [Diatraea saccharalis]